MTWEVLVRPKAGKTLKRFPEKDIKRIKAVLENLRTDAFSGNVEKMEGEKNVWRQRVGSYRISYELYPETKIVYVFRIERRTTTTYRRR